MKGKLSYIQKKYGLVALALLLAWAGWQLAFKKTISLYLQYKEITQQAKVATDFTYPGQYIGRRRANLDKIIKGYQEDSTMFRDNLLYQAAYQASKQEVKVVQVPGQERGVNQSILQKITFQGSYFGLVQLLCELKKAKDIGKIRSVKIRQPGQADKISQTAMEVYFVCLSKKS